jgi:UDP-glucose:(heptosyl)LPS alpha-1,3-glucosyltransferase
MEIAFGIVSLFLNGGLQRNCIAIAGLLRDRGHKITIFASRLDGPLPSDLSIKVIPNRAWSNHARDLQFARDFAGATSGRFDRIVGFNKLSDLPILYCADPPATAARTWWKRLTPRYRTRYALESACFSPQSKTSIIAMSQAQMEAYAAIWGTPAERFVLMPPSLERERKHPELRGDGSRARSRATLGLDKDDWCWLAIGRQPRTKGFDRAVAVLPSFPKARLLIMGLDSAAPGAKRLLREAQRIGVDRRVVLLGFVPDDNVPSLLAAADLLVHPTRLDIGGAVILEAMINGLPVVTTAACGYAPHVQQARAGIVVPEPFETEALRAALREANDSKLLAEWSSNGVRYGEEANLFSGLEKAADFIIGSALS